MRFQEEDENVKSLRTTDNGRRTTDDGRKRTAIAHSSLRLRWAKKEKYLLTDYSARRIVAEVTLEICFLHYWYCELLYPCNLTNNLLFLSYAHQKLSDCSKRQIIQQEQLCRKSSWLLFIASSNWPCLNSSAFHLRTAYFTLYVYIQRSRNATRW